MSGSQRPRVFRFDKANKKYRYFYTKDDPEDVKAKAMNLTLCDYEVSTKENPGEFKWDDPTGTANYRLTMKFEERAKRPIFVYSANANELHGLKCYGVYCVKTRGDEASRIRSKLERLLAALFYAHGTYAWNTMVSVFERIADRSQRASQLIANLVDGAALLERQKNFMLIAWAKIVGGKHDRYKPRPTIRIATFLRSLARIKNPNEEQILESARKILKAHREHRASANMMFDEEIRERASRGSRGMSAAAIYTVSSKVMPIMMGKVPISSEHMSLTIFEFPSNAFHELNFSPRIDWERFKIVLETDKIAGKRKVLGELSIGDVSSMVINDIPEKMKGDGRKWLRINGRKIVMPESFSIFYINK